MIVGGGVEARQKAAAGWLRGFSILVLVCLAAFVANVVVSEVESGNWWGLSYGIVAAVLMLAAMALGIRRRTMKAATKLRMGRSRTWLYVHIYGGLLSLLLVLMHAEFRLPVGIVTTWLYWLSILTILSGLLGLGLQKWIPRVLSSGLSMEVLYDRIPDLTDDLRQRAEALVRKSGDPVRDLYRQKLEPAFRQPRYRWMYFLDVSAGIQSELREFGYLGRFLTPEERGHLDELERLYRAKLEIDAHYTLQSGLRYWHYSHVPISLMLLGFLFLHVFSVYYW